MPESRLSSVSLSPAASSGKRQEQTRRSENMDGTRLRASVLKHISISHSNERSKKSCAESVAVGPFKECVTSTPSSFSTLCAKNFDSASCNKNCLCAPTTHIGSFRCRLHRLPPPPVIMPVAKASRNKMSTNPHLKLTARSFSSSPSVKQEPKTSRLNKGTIAKEQKQATSFEQPSCEHVTSVKVSAGLSLESGNHSKASSAGVPFAYAKRRNDNNKRPLVKLKSI